MLVRHRARLAVDAGSARAPSGVLTRESHTEWSPGGFEVKIVGPSGARRVWLHLAIEAVLPGAEDSLYQTNVGVAAHDL